MHCFHRPDPVTSQAPLDVQRKIKTFCFCDWFLFTTWHSDMGPLRSSVLRFLDIFFVCDDTLHHITIQTDLRSNLSQDVWRVRANSLRKQSLPWKQKVSLILRFRNETGTLCLTVKCTSAPLVSSVELTCGLYGLSKSNAMSFFCGRVQFFC